MTRALNWTSFGPDAETATVLRDGPIRWGYGILRFYGAPKPFSVRLNGAEVGRATNFEEGRAVAQTDFNARLADLGKMEAE